MLDNMDYDWDDWSGEEWVTFIRDKKSVCHLSVKIPVVFVLKEYVDIYSAVEFFKNIQLVSIDDFDETM